MARQHRDIRWLSKRESEAYGPDFVREILARGGEEDTLLKSKPGLVGQNRGTTKIIPFCQILGLAVFLLLDGSVEGSHLDLGNGPVLFAVCRNVVDHLQAARGRAVVRELSVDFLVHS